MITLVKGNISLVTRDVHKGDQFKDWAEVENLFRDEECFRPFKSWFSAPLDPIVCEIDREVEEVQKDVKPKKAGRPPKTKIKGDKK